MNAQIQYDNHIFGKDIDGYIQLVQLNNGKVIKIYNSLHSQFRDIVEEFENEVDTFVTVNTMYIPKRNVGNIRQFRALYIDIDNVEGDQVGVSYQVLNLAEKGEIPYPSMIISSGRGLHVYWRIKNAPFGALQTWQELEDMLYHKLKRFGADIKATDAARVLRLPGTINSKNDVKCSILMVDNNLEYSMYELRERFLNYKPIKQQLEILQTKKQSNVVTNRLFNSYSLHISRAQDIITLCGLRNYNVTGYRNMIIHCYAYWKGIYIRDIDELAKEVYELNNSFSKPLVINEVDAVLRCIPKAIQKFINYEQGIRNGERKRVSKGMRDKEGYWYKNQTLIERLNITIEEQKNLKTIIGTEEKYRRNNASRREKRRNEEGLTKREQKKKEKEKEIKLLINKGYNMNQVAKALGINRSTISRTYKHLFI